MNLQDWSDGKAVLEDYKELTEIIQKPNYAAADKAALVAIMSKYPGLLTNGVSTYIRLRENRGKLVHTQGGQRVIAANGRGDWIGWFEVEKEPVKETAIENTARVIKEVDADLLGVVEAEHRTGLLQFNEIVLPQVGGTPYAHVMLIDGNNDRGIDVGLMTKGLLPIETMRSHVDDRDTQGERIFSRDCPEYHIPLQGGGTILVMMNHLKSKRYGSLVASNARRKAQAQQVRDIYEERKQQGDNFIAIMGDMNDTPDSDPLQPLLGNGSDLRDVFTHQSFNNQGRPGTHGNCTASGKLDYILLSPALWNTVSLGSVAHQDAYWLDVKVYPNGNVIRCRIRRCGNFGKMWPERTVCTAPRTAPFAQAVAFNEAAPAIGRSPFSSTTQERESSSPQWATAPTAVRGRGG